MKVGDMLIPEGEFPFRRIKYSHDFKGKVEHVPESYHKIHIRVLEGKAFDTEFNDTFIHGHVFCDEAFRFIKIRGYSKFKIWF